VSYLSFAIEEGFAVMLEALAEFDEEAFGETFLDLLRRFQETQSKPADS
jgi:hypothetical protein